MDEEILIDFTETLDAGMNNSSMTEDRILLQQAMMHPSNIN